MDFTQVKNREEIILWRGKPDFLAYFFKDIAAIIGLCSWLSILFFLPWIVASLADLASLQLAEIYPAGEELTQQELELHTGAFALVLTIFTFPLILVVLIVLFAPINTFLNYLDEDYALTDQRIIISKGAFNTRIVSFYYDEIKNLELSSNLLDNLLGLGTIKVYSGSISFEGGLATAGKDWLVSIEDYQRIYMTIKSKAVSLSKAEYIKI